MDKRFKPVIWLAQSSQKLTGCPACVTLAQWALESGYGVHLAASNNPFGIKWTYNSPYPCEQKETTEHINGKDVKVVALFVKYPNLETAFIEHGKKLMNPKGPYRTAIPFAKDWKKFIAHVAPIYATDKNYASKLITIIVNNQLDKV